MDWSLFGGTSRVFIANGALNGHRYIKEIVQDHVVLFMTFLRAVADSGTYSA